VVQGIFERGKGSDVVVGVERKCGHLGSPV
jgi:hypothetical protein